MKQLTAKTRAEALHWMETHEHHKASGMTPGFFILEGYHARLRIPTAIVMKLEYGPTKGHYFRGGAFDTRMYRPTKLGRAMIRRAIKRGELS